MNALRSFVRFRRPPASALPGALICGLAAWVSGGALAIVTDATRSRVGFLPAWWLPVAVAIAVIAAASVVPVRPRAWRALLFPGVLLLPWLPFPVPSTFLVWTGPLVWWVWSATAISFVLAAWPAGAGAPEWLRNERRAPLAAFVAAILVYGASAWWLSPRLPGGDEPHYLVITQSLLKDGDLRIENNHLRGDYRPYFQGNLRPDYLRRGKDREIYSVHAPGLPVLVAPAFAIGGYPAVVVFLALVAALGGALLWRLAFALTGSPSAAWFGWASIVASTPFFFHAFQVFPDATGAVLTLTGVGALVGLELEGRNGSAPSTPPRALVRWALHGAALAALPWLHTRYVVIAAVLGGAIGLRLLRNRAYRQLAVFAAIPFAGAVAWFSFFYVIYGRFSPTAPYGAYTQSALGNIPRGITGLLFDQQFGLLPSAPVYALAFAGLAVMLRRFPRLAKELALVVVSYLLVTAMYHMWWGGHSVAARFAVPVLLSLGLAAAAWWAASPRARGAGTVALVLTVLVTLSLLLVRSGALIFNDRDGFARWLDWLSPVVDLPGALPTLFRGARTVLTLQIAAWLAAMSAGIWVARRLAAHAGGEIRGRLAVALPWIVALAVMAGTSAGWSIAGAAPLAPTTAQMDLLRHYDPAALPLGVDFTRGLNLVSAPDVLPRLRITTAANRPWPRGPALLALGDVPAGSYRLDAASVAAARGEARITIGRSPEVVRSWTFDPDGSSSELLVHLPVSVDGLTIAGDETAARTIPSLALQPVSVLPAGDRASMPRARRASHYDGAVVYAFDDNAYLEQPGFWVKGGRDVSVVVCPDPPASTCRLLVRNGGVDNAVQLRAGKWEATLRLEARAEQVVEMPVDGASGAALLKVRAERGFTPAEMEPGSRDPRYLGVWLQPVR